MNYLISMLFLLIAIPLPAQIEASIDQLPTKYSQDRITTSSIRLQNSQDKVVTSIMFQNTHLPLATLQWENHLLGKQKGRIVATNTIRGALIGSIIGSLSMLPVQIFFDDVRALLTWKERQSYGIVVFGGLVGGAIGSRRGYIRGKQRAERFEYEEFMKQAKKNGKW